jgi:hypothetical protein
MNWYVRYEGTGEVQGPMSRDEALLRAGEADCLVFHERIFEPQFVASEEVKVLLRRVAEQRRQIEERPKLDLDHQSILDVIIEAGEMIILLSAKKRITGTIEGGVLSLDEVPAGVSIDVRDYDVVGEEDYFEEDEEGRTFSPFRWES